MRLRGLKASLVQETMCSKPLCTPDPGSGQHVRKASIYTASGRGLQGRLPGGEGSAEWGRMRSYYLHRQGRAV